MIQPLPVYCYDRLGAFTERLMVPGEADSIGQIIYRLPKDSTIVAPIGVDDGHRPVFLERTQSWIEVSDHRGETWFDWKGEPQKIERLGNPELWDLFRENPRVPA